MLGPIPEYPQSNASHIQSEKTTNKIAHAKHVTLKPQITKEYIYTQTVGKPDFKILQDGYETGGKFYEPQYSMIQNRKCQNET